MDGNNNINDRSPCDLVRSTVNRMIERRLTIAVAESCTGGLLANCITDVPGSSDTFLAGIVSYSNKSKRDLINVKQASLEKEGAVSETVAREMAAGIRKVSGSDIGIGITGVAGPGGGSAAKPVGLVFIAVDFRGIVNCTINNFSGTRRDIKEKAVKTVFGMLQQIL